MNMKMMTACIAILTSTHAFAICRPTSPAELEMKMKDIPAAKLSLETRDYLRQQDRRAHLSEVIACVAMSESIHSFDAELAIHKMNDDYQAEVRATYENIQQVQSLLTKPSLDPKLAVQYEAWIKQLNQKIQDRTNDHAGFISKIRSLTK